VGNAPLGTDLGGVSTHFIQRFKNAFLSRNLDQNMLKNAYFLKKAEKSPQYQELCPQTTIGFQRLGDPPTQTLALLLLPKVIALSSAFLSLNVFYYFEK